MDKPEALKALLKPIYPDIHSILSMENDGDYVTFEWIGHENYLQEKMRGQIRTRGANFTSADAAVMVENNDGSRQIILIEWKYTESYSSQSKTVAKSGTDRVAIYQHLYDKDDFPLDKSRLPSFDSLFYEPFYQFFRQQALASEMERAGELNTDRVSLLHIAPKHNTDFQKITSQLLTPFGSTVTQVWSNLMRDKTRFQSISTEELFSQFPSAQFPELQRWWRYIVERYSWVND